jgi:hypothetical protein
MIRLWWEVRVLTVMGGTSPRLWSNFPKSIPCATGALFDGGLRNETGEDLLDED